MPTPTPTATTPETVQLIPRQVLIGNPDKALAQLSPDGTRISYLAPLDGVLNVWVGPADDPVAAKPVTSDTVRGIRAYFWAFTNDHILYIQDKAGDENWRVYSVDLSTGQTRDLTPFEGVQARIQEVSPRFPEDILIGLNDRNPQLHDLHRVNIATGERQLVQENDQGFLEFITDDHYNIRFASLTTPDGGSEFFRPAGDGSWTPFIKIEMEDSLTTSLVAFDKTGRVLYMVDSRRRNTAALTATNLDTGEQTVIAEDARADISDAMVHPTEKTIQAAAFTYQRKRWQVLDDSIAPDLEYLGTVTDGDIEVVSRTLDDKHWIVAYLLDDGPVRYYRYDREESKAEFLFSNQKRLEGLPLAKMHPVVIKSRDGLNLVSYLSLPVASDSNGDVRPDKPLPMVLWVHGGPWGRDKWGYNTVHQTLANRGYAVLSVNFRASTGFGKEFINAGNLEWGGKMHDDLIDAVEWAIAEGIADPKRIAIGGASYGGYAALVGMTFTPETFACGVDIVGISNLVSWANTIPAYWQPQIEVLTSRMGDHRTEEGRAFLSQRSPLTHVDRIKRPLLIAQGANDPRVNQAESDQIVQAMEEKNIPVTYVLYSDEGHGFARPENNLSFAAVMEAFLAECLGGRFQPVGDDLQGSSITVPTGAEFVPGLTEALADAGISQASAPELQPLTAEALAEFAAYIEETRESFNVPGMAVVVVQGGEVVFAQGFGVKEARGADPVTPDTVFSIGSLTKAMTSMMTATLVDQGLMGWDTRVVEVMPQFQLSDTDATGKITIKHLFAHTTGLPNTDLALLFAGLPPEGFVEFLKGVPLSSQPGESRTYHNQAYAVGAYVAAMAAGGEYGDNLVETYIDLMERRVFAPIGMSTATFSIEEAQANPDHATPHYITLNGTLAQTGFDITPTHYWDIGALAPAGAVRASARDVGRFLMTMLAEGVAPDGTRVVSGENLAETWTQQIEINAEPFLEGAGAALGWGLADYQGITVVTHGGAVSGFSSQMAFVPGADTGIVVLNNVDTLGLALGRNVQYRLVEMLYGLEPKVEELAKAELGQIAGLSDLYSQLLPVDPDSVAS